MRSFDRGLLKFIYSEETLFSRFSSNSEAVDFSNDLDMSIYLASVLCRLTTYLSRHCGLRICQILDICEAVRS